MTLAQRRSRLQRSGALRHNGGVEPERDFAAWLDRRDAEALGRVFDATGGKLLLLATHLAGSGASAQDLVQATFLAAMAHGASWDRARPLWPWLAAILQNEVRMQARRGRRRREVALEEVDAEARGQRDPQQLAASEEVLAAVLAAIDALPLPYRQVLRLRLVHGLRPVDIARSLEVPVGTVRAQLHRGLEHLRGSLPAGVAAVHTSLLLGDDALLAQVKERLLEHAGGATAVTASALLATGWWTMNGKTIGAVIAGCFVLACLAFATGLPESLWTRAADVSPARPVQTELPIAAADAPKAPAARGEREAVTANDAVWPLIVTVQTPDGAPIAGAAVSVSTSLPGGVYWYRDASEFGREDLAAGATGADGVFRTSLDDLRKRSPLRNRTTWLSVEASWPHSSPRQQLVALPRTNDTQSVTATIELRRCRVITGRAVDSAGTAVAGAHVTTSRSLSLEGGEPPTRADGTFFVDCEGDAERWPEQVVLASPAHGNAIVAVPAWNAEARGLDLGTIVLQVNDVVHGRVVLGDGTALGGIQLRLSAIDPALGDDLVAIHRWLMRDSRENQSLVMRDGRAVWEGAVTNTRADGSFRFTGLRPDGVYLLSVWAVRAPVEAVVRPGGEPVELRIDQQLLAIDVFDESGVAVPGAQVRLAGYDPSSTHPSYQKWPGFPETGLVCSNWPPGAAPDGRRIFLAPFGFVFRLTVADDCMQPIAVRHDVLPGVYRATCRVDVRLEDRFGKLHICAVDENGKPIDFGPYLKALDRELQVNGRRFIKPPEGWTWDLPAGRWHVEAVLGKEVAYLHDDGGYARGFQEHVVTVEDGKTTELRLVAPPGGLVEFDVRANKAAITSWRTLRVEEAGRELAVLPRDSSHPLPTRQGARITTFVTKQALAPGKHSFLLLAEGYQPATCEVDVVADQLTTVRVEMFPK